jgi:hypothetical protein
MSSRRSCSAILTLTVGRSSIERTVPSLEITVRMSVGSVVLSRAGLRSIPSSRPVVVVAPERISTRAPPQRVIELNEIWTCAQWDTQRGEPLLEWCHGVVADRQDLPVVQVESG